jgi:hypothetical protein
MKEPLSEVPLSSEDQKAAIKWVADHSEMIQCQNPHSAAREGFRAGIRYLKDKDSIEFKIGGTNENYGTFRQYSTAIFDDKENCVGRSFANTHEESVRIAKRFVGRKAERIAELEAEVARLKEDGSEAQRMYYQVKRERDQQAGRIIDLEAALQSAGSSPAESEVGAPIEKTEHCGGVNCPNFEYACVDGCLNPVIHKSTKAPTLKERNSRLVECLQYFIMFTEGAKRFGIELENSSIMAKAKAAIESEETKKGA